MNTLTLNVDPGLLRTTAFGAGALVRVERSATGGGAGFAEITTLPLVAGAMVLTYDDQTGTSSHWYRWRYSNAGNTLQSAYSDEIAAPAPVATYAAVSDLLTLLPDLPAGSARDRALLVNILGRASDHITTRCGRDFYRHPSVYGTEIRTFDGRGGLVLPVVAGIVSLTLVEIASVTGAAYVALAGTDWFLRPAAPEPGDSFYAVVLSDISGRIFHPGRNTVRLTGVFGYAKTPPIIVDGTLALARQLYALTPSATGSVAGGVEYGVEAIPNSVPIETYRAIEWGRKRCSDLFL